MLTSPLSESGCTKCLLSPLRESAAEGYFIWFRMLCCCCWINNIASGWMLVCYICYLCTLTHFSETVIHEVVVKICQYKPKTSTYCLTRVFICSITSGCASSSYWLSVGEGDGYQCFSVVSTIRSKYQLRMWYNIIATCTMHKYDPIWAVWIPHLSVDN